MRISYIDYCNGWYIDVLRIIGGPEALGRLSQRDSRFLEFYTLIPTNQTNIFLLKTLVLEENQKLDSPDVLSKNSLLWFVCIQALPFIIPSKIICSLSNHKT